MPLLPDIHIATTFYGASGIQPHLRVSWSDLGNMIQAVEKEGNAERSSGVAGRPRLGREYAGQPALEQGSMQGNLPQGVAERQMSTSVLLTSPHSPTPSVG